MTIPRLPLASQVIARLNACILEYGDLPVYVHDADTDWLLAPGLTCRSVTSWAPARFEITSEYCGEPDGFFSAPDDIVSP